MLRKLAWLVLALFLTFGTSSTWADSADDLHGLADILRAQGEFLRAVGEARLSWAKARLVDAQAMEQEERVKMLRQFTKRLEIEMRRLYQDEYKIREKVKSLEGLLERLGPINNGRTSVGIFRALKMIFSKYIPPGMLVEVMQFDVGSFPKEHFLRNSMTKDPLGSGFGGGNFGQYLRFLELNDVSVEPWSEAHFEILAGFDRIGSKVSELMKAQLELMAALKKGTLDLWEVPGDTSGIEPPEAIKPDPSLDPGPENPNEMLFSEPEFGRGSDEEEAESFP